MRDLDAAKQAERDQQLNELARLAYPGDTYETDEERVFGLICELTELNAQQSHRGQHSVDFDRAMILDAVLENVTEEGWKVARR